MAPISKANSNGAEKSYARSDDSAFSVQISSSRNFSPASGEFPVAKKTGATVA